MEIGQTGTLIRFGFTTAPPPSGKSPLRYSELNATRLPIIITRPYGRMSSSLKLFSLPPPRESLFAPSPQSLSFSEDSEEYEDQIFPTRSSLEKGRPCAG